MPAFLGIFTMRPLHLFIPSQASAAMSRGRSLANTLNLTGPGFGYWVIECRATRVLH